MQNWRPPPSSPAHFVSSPPPIGAIEQQDLVCAVAVQVQEPGIAGQGWPGQAGRNILAHFRPILGQQRRGRPRPQCVHNDIGADFHRGGGTASPHRGEGDRRIARDLGRAALRHARQRLLAKAHAAPAQIIELKRCEIHLAGHKPRGLCRHRQARDQGPGRIKAGVIAGDDISVAHARPQQGLRRHQNQLRQDRQRDAGMGLFRPLDAQ